MTPIWSQRSSVTRDFTLLSGVIVFIALLSSIWVTFEAFEDQSTKISRELELESLRINRGIQGEVENATTIVSALTRLIIQQQSMQDADIERIFRAFHNSHPIASTLLWINAENNITISSQHGLLPRPIFAGDTPLIASLQRTRSKIQIGQPEFNLFTERNIIPIVSAVTDYRGHFLGYIVLTLDLQRLIDRAQEYSRNPEVGFALLDNNYTLLAKDARATYIFNNKALWGELSQRLRSTARQGLITKPKLIGDKDIFSFIQKDAHQQYYVLTLYKSEWSAVKRLILPRLVQLLLVAAFLVSLLWLVRYRIIYPVQELANAASHIAKGKTSGPVPLVGPVEVTQLGRQLSSITQYINERRRIEEELFNKVLSLKTSKDLAEVSDQVKMELLTGLRKELFPSVEQMLSSSSLLQAQPYGAIEQPEYRAAIEKLDENGMHITEIIHEILEFPRHNEGDYTLYRRPLDVENVLKKCLNLINNIIRKEEVSISLKAADDLPRLPMQELHLMHVLVHLIMVAIRVIPPGGDLTIELTTQAQEKETEFALLLKDNGTGLDTQYIAQAWRQQPAVLKGSRSFYREDDKAGSLTAITLTKKIVSLYNGRITLENPPGQEAVIGVYFPL